ncbi:MAG: EAL domain-containing protein, partial [Clostridia bacterium]|nr:EAL domain-containing protein [Clostridia bacterium]
DSEDGGYRFFNEEMKQRYNRQLALREALTNLANGKEDGCLYMVYQPIVDLKTDTISGFEALARYKHPQLGFVSPVEFIPLIEKYQLILPLGNIIMQQVFRFALKVTQQNPALTMAFNISAIQLLSDSFYQSLTAMLTKTGVNPNRIVIEITESIFIDNFQEVNNRLTEIRKLGIRIAIDDFGTGYSSLSREKELKVDCLKIDKQFIDSLLTDDPEKSIVSDIISMAHKLGHSVVAEGVETEEQMKYLIQYRCDLMQGYWYSKPLEEQAALEFVRKKSD